MGADGCVHRNVKLYAGPRPNSTTMDEVSDQTNSENRELTWQAEEENETAQSIRIKQNRMEQQVYQIWT